MYLALHPDEHSEEGCAKYTTAECYNPFTQLVAVSLLSHGSNGMKVLSWPAELQVVRAGVIAVYVAHFFVFHG